MTVNNTGSAGGVPNRTLESTHNTDEKRWVVAIVKNNTEKACEEKLAKMGLTTYVPTQTEVRRWSNGRKKTIQRIVIPSILFLHVDEKERLAALNCPLIHKFMTNKASRADQFNRHPIATIPNRQIEMLQFMLYHADQPVTIEGRPLHIGDSVRVVRGNLQGLEGYIQDYHQGGSSIIVNLDILGCARVNINRGDVEKICL
jgi:transcription antitermination factor NusG